MPESKVDLIITTKREGDAIAETNTELKGMEAGLSEVEKAISGTRTTIGKLDQDITVFGQNIGTTADFLSGMGVSIPVTPMQLFGQAVQIAGQYAAESLGEFSSYIGEIDRLSKFTGVSTEEMSRLLKITSDMRIESGASEEALKKMTENGMTPTIRNLEGLADEYNALNNPLQRSQFLMEKFGEAGIEMARIMDLGSEGISNMAGSVEDWMIVSGRSQEELYAYGEALNRWEDATNRAQYAIGSRLMPIMTDLIGLITITEDEWDSAIDSLGSGWEKVGNILLALQGQLPPTTSRLENQADAVNDLAASYDTAANSASNFAGKITALENTRRGSIYDRENYGSIYDVPTLGGARAEGGDVFENQIYKFGEREVEYVSMPANGFVTPASQANAAPITIVYSPLISTLDRTEAVNKLIPIINEANRRR